MITLNNENFIDQANFSLDNFETFEPELERLSGLMQREVKDLESRVEKIKTDRNLSRAGMDEKLADVYAEKKEYFEKMRVDFENQYSEESFRVAERLNQALAENKFTTGDRAADEVRAQEIRRWFQGIDPVLREETLKAAVNSGDTELIDAVTSAPKCLNICPQSLVEHIQKQRAAKLSPGNANLSKDIETLKSTMHYNFIRVDKILEPLKRVAVSVRPEDFDPLFRLARGKR